jgi:two-component system phosphate regulon response regulator PhoB
MKSKILVVEDEPDALELILFNLRAAGYEVITAENGQEALRKARTTNPDLMLLDLMLPELDGLEVCKLLRRDPATANLPIIMLTARAAEIDRILGLEIGADDYVTKPFSARELVLRIKKLLQRRHEEAAPQDRYQAGPLVVDLARHTAMVQDRPVVLTATEFRLLTTLMQRRGRVQSRDQLLRDVWDYERNVETRTVDTHVRRIRDKLGVAAKFLETVRNVGYRFVEDA